MNRREFARKGGLLALFLPVVPLVARAEETKTALAPIPPPPSVPLYREIRNCKFVMPSVKDLPDGAQVIGVQVHAQNVIIQGCSVEAGGHMQAAIAIDQVPPVRDVHVLRSMFDHAPGGVAVIETTRFSANNMAT